MTRDEYARWNSLGKNVKVSPEEEAELPMRFQSGQTVSGNDPKDDCVDNEVADELIRYQKQVGRELTAEEVNEIHQSPKMHGWIRFCKTNHEHNSARRRAQGWTLSEGDHGHWTRKN
jgi:hypothetical protein